MWFTPERWCHLAYGRSAGYRLIQLMDLGITIARPGTTATRQQLLAHRICAEAEQLYNQHGIQHHQSSPTLHRQSVMAEYVIDAGQDSGRLQDAPAQGRPHMLEWTSSRPQLTWPQPLWTLAKAQEARGAPQALPFVVSTHGYAEGSLLYYGVVFRPEVFGDSDQPRWTVPRHMDVRATLVVFPDTHSACHLLPALLLRLPFR
ncbi:hypothetical protein CYMTET_48227 [Cymbomonas tetramitiformis]|uniref:Uncharacterized protein n=1 Tax=Cymbomonas tetramitiformis TaxID=36881 RepID=A0AAE0BSQ7_9CHLO|nr:hypothetical protein CYMTET_48227 [Cymbomonas tetramitiformis]